MKFGHIFFNWKINFPIRNLFSELVLHRVNQTKFGKASEMECCSSMLIQLVEWVIEYEKEIQDKLGTDYRASTLQEWNNGERVFIPAKNIIDEWVKIRDGLKNPETNLYNGWI